MTEIWKPAVGYEGWYEVSDQGRVRRVRAANARGRIRSTGIIKAFPDARGYPKVRLFAGRGGKTLHVHKLVAEAFLGPRPPGTEVNHIHGDKGNPALVELEYLTRAENIRHGCINGLFASRPGESNPAAVLTVEKVKMIDRLLCDGVRHNAIARRAGVSPYAIYCINGGFTWSEVTDRPKRILNSKRKAGGTK